MKELIFIQKMLKAPKGQYNSFGKYNYRSCEDILEAVKPLLYSNDCMLTLSDSVEAVGDRVYVKATATIISEDKQFSVSAYAREAANKKGMDDSQITGTASSYARKYALNGLFLIDDTKDADTMDNRQDSKPENRKADLQQALDFFVAQGMGNRADVVKDILDGKQVKHTVDQVLEAYRTEKAKVKQ